MLISYYCLLINMIIRLDRSSLSQLQFVNVKFIECIRTCVEVLYTDMSKAYNFIAHYKLIMKEKAYGISYNVCQWISDFFISLVSKSCS